MGKKYDDAAKKYDKTQLHEPAKAFELVKSLSNRNFDESVEVAFKLGVDPRKADQMLRSTVSLPAGTGKDVRVAVFAAGDAAQEARDAGADDVGTRLLGCSGGVALGEHRDAHALAGALGQRHRAAQHLVGLAGVDAEAERGLDGLVELAGGHGLDQVDGLGRCEQLLAVVAALRVDGLLAGLAHVVRLSLAVAPSVVPGSAGEVVRRGLAPAGFSR